MDLEPIRGVDLLTAHERHATVSWLWEGMLAAGNVTLLASVCKADNLQCRSRFNKIADLAVKGTQPRPRRPEQAEPERACRLFSSASNIVANTTTFPFM